MVKIKDIYIYVLVMQRYIKTTSVLASVLDLGSAQDKAPYVPKSPDQYCCINACNKLTKKK